LGILGNWGNGVRAKVDREQRRVELAEAVWRVIDKRGIENVSIRNVADESQWTRGVIQLYFRDKDDLLDAALDLVAGQTDEIAARVTAPTITLDTVRSLLMLYARPDEERRLAFVVLQALATRAFSHDDFGRRYRELHVDWQERTRRLFLTLAASGEVRDDIPPADLADHYYAFAMGLSFEYYVDPESMGRGRAERMVDSFIRSVAPLLDQPTK
jgi:AcrR family transcriptional regulator